MKIKSLYYMASARIMQHQAGAVATTIQNSTFVKGTKKLFKDGSSALLIIIPVAVVVACLWHLFQLQGAEENETPNIKKKIKQKIIAGIFAEAFDATFTLILNYYSG